MADIPLTDLTSLYACTCQKLGSGLQSAYAMIFYVLNGFRREVIVHFVDIGKTVNHHCLNLYDNQLQQSQDTFIH